MSESNNNIARHRHWLSPAVEEQIRRRRGALHPFENFDPRTTALLVIDMQTAFLSKEFGDIALPSAPATVPIVNRVATVLRKAGGSVVWIISTYGPNSDDRWRVFMDHVVSKSAAEKFQELFSEGNKGHELWAGLDRREQDAIIVKNRFGAFYGSSGKLDELLKKVGADTLLIAGLQTSICCETTAREAAMRDFRTVMIEDANACRIQEDANACRIQEEAIASFSIFLRAFGDVQTSDQVIKRIERFINAG